MSQTVEEAKKAPLTGSAFSVWRRVFKIDTRSLKPGFSLEKLRIWRVK